LFNVHLYHHGLWFDLDEYIATRMPAYIIESGKLQYHINFYHYRLWSKMQKWTEKLIFKR